MTECYAPPRLFHPCRSRCCCCSSNERNRNSTWFANSRIIRIRCRKTNCCLSCCSGCADATRRGWPDCRSGSKRQTCACGYWAAVMNAVLPPSHSACIKKLLGNFIARETFPGSKASGEENSVCCSLFRIASYDRSNWRVQDAIEIRTQRPLVLTRMWAVLGWKGYWEKDSKVTRSKAITFVRNSTSKKGNIIWLVLDVVPWLDLLGCFWNVLVFDAGRDGRWYRRRTGGRGGRDQWPAGTNTIAAMVMKERCLWNLGWEDRCTGLRAGDSASSGMMVVRQGSSCCGVGTFAAVAGHRRRGRRRRFPTARVRDHCSRLWCGRIRPGPLTLTLLISSDSIK